MVKIGKFHKAGVAGWELISKMDKQYWDKFYKDHSNRSDISECSTFASFCCDNFFKKSKVIAELGCGNARDALFFAEQEHYVLAVDQSIDDKVKTQKAHVNLEFLETDFVRPKYYFHDGETSYYHPTPNKIDVFYSRFTIHSITEQDQKELLPKVHNFLDLGGLFCIEVRTTKDPKFGIGKHICDTTYFNDGHTRRFIDSQEFLNEVLNLGFKLKYFNEQDNLSVYKDDNPVLMRIILEK